jgi:4-amino-4-deoxy-L-arabinose transferase-like glycosyltransferase
MAVRVMPKKRRNRRREPAPTVRRVWTSHLATWALLAVILFFAVIRFRLADIPLERDEGEYAYAGQLMLHGVPPYQLAYNMKFPGTYAAYALMMAIFGETSKGIHAGFLVLNIATVILVYLLGRKLFGNTAGAVSGMAYACLSASSAVLGLAAHATHFVVLAAVGGILLLLHALESDRALLFFLSGTCLGLAFLMKQPGIVFPMFAFAYLAYRKWDQLRNWRHVIWLSAALLLGIAWPFGITCLLLYGAGTLPRFWFWTFGYARAYGTQLPMAAALHNFWGSASGLLQFDAGLWLIAGIGVVTLFFSRQARTHAFLVLSLLGFSCLGVSAGLYFRPHYFVLLLPAAALLCGIAVAHSTEAMQGRLGTVARAIPALAFAGALIFSLLKERPFFFAANSEIANRMLYYGNPFVEARAVAEYIKQNSAPDAKLAVFGSEPEIYFYAQRRSATGYIYTYPLMEEQEYAARMQNEMLEEVMRARPEYAVFVDDRFSWLWHPGGLRQEFMNKILRYLSTAYESAAEVPILGEPEHGLGDAAKIYIFRRKAQ